MILFKRFGKIRFLLTKAKNIEDFLDQRNKTIGIKDVTNPFAKRIVLIFNAL